MRWYIIAPPRSLSRGTLALPRSDARTLVVTALTAGAERACPACCSARVCCGSRVSECAIVGSSPTGGTLLGVAASPLYCSRQRVQVEARLALIFLARCAIWSCCALWLLAPSGSPCGVLRGVESPVCVLGCLRCESLREARTGRFTLVSGSRGVAWFLRWCYCGVWRLAVISRVSMPNW